jgi:hypothetical protein
MLTLSVVVIIILFLVILAGLFYTPPAPYGSAGKFIAADGCPDFIPDRLERHTLVGYGTIGV